MSEERFDHWFGVMPIVAILRGIDPDEAVEVGEVLIESGIHILEVPLNSPQPLSSIAKLSAALKDRAIVGAGTVLTASGVDAVAEASGAIIVSPNTDPLVIKQTRQRGLVSLPGSFTPTEAFLSLSSGAHAIKLFPGELVTPKSATGLAAVLPAKTRMLVVGGVSADSLHEWSDSPVHGFGIGSSLYKPGRRSADVGERARKLVAAVRAFAEARRG